MGRLVIAGLENMAKEMGSSRKTVYKWIKERDFPAFKMDGTWRVLAKDVVEWMEEQRGARPRPS